MEQEQAEKLTEALSTKTNITELKLNDVTFNERSTTHLAQIIAQSPDMEDISLTGTEFTDQGIKQLHSSVSGHDNIATSKIAADANSTEAINDCIQLMLQSQSINFIHSDLWLREDADFQALYDLASHNSSANYDRLDNAFDSESRLKTDTLSCLELAELEARSASIKDDHGPKRGALEQINAFIDTLPISSPETCTREELLTPNDKGYAPIDNPRIWKHMDEILDALNEKGTPLTVEDFLQQREKNGESHSLLETVLAGKGAGKLKTLNNAGIQIPLDVMVQDGEASPLLQNLLDQGTAKHLLSPANVKKQGTGITREVFKLLEAADQAPANVNSMFLSAQGNPNIRGREI